MRSTSLVVLSLALSLSLVACKKPAPAAGKDHAPAGKPAPTTPPPAAGPDVAAWDLAGKAKAWTGSWVVKDNGSFQAWTAGADGRVAVTEDGKTASYKLDVELPCLAYFAADGGMKYPHPFTVLADGALEADGNGAGFRKGAEAIYCDPSGTVYVLGADGSCTGWKQELDWSKTAATCSLGKNADGKDVFKHGDPNGGEFLIEGDAILGGASARTEKAADHAAAQAAATSKNAAK